MIMFALTDQKCFAEINKHTFTNTKQAYVISSNICLRSEIIVKLDSLSIF